MQKRKRLDDLFAAFKILNRDDTGLILVGPDTDGLLGNIQGRNIYKVGPVYGSERLELLSAADIFCLPGAVGLSIVDAFHCGLPFVTEAGDESPEIMYLKDGVNGFIVPRGNIEELKSKLELLLDDSDLRNRLACEAKHEISTNGHIDKMCDGFRRALDFVFHETIRPEHPVS
jgi:glycosyltransferase involved in cell wall biosynthesis